MDKVKLGTVMTLHRGYDLPNSKRENGDIPVISSSGISGLHSTAKLNGPNVITGRYGTIGKVFYYDGPCWPLNTTLYVSDFHGNDSHYVAYLLEAMLNVMQIDRADKSTVPGVDRNVLHDLTVPFTADVEDQKAISGILSAIDDKIANNKKLMAELEETAQLVYDYWFTQFDFPDQDGKPYRASGGKMVWSPELKREIPEGWEAKRVIDLVSIDKGVSYASGDLLGSGVPMISLASFNTDGTYKPEAIKTYSGKLDARKSVKPNDLIMCVTQQTAIDLTGKTNVIGKAMLTPDVFKGTAAISTDVVKLTPCDEGYSYVLGGLFKRPDIHRHIVGFANGTKIKHLDVTGALELSVALPSDGELPRLFAKLRKQSMSEYSTLLKECDELSSLRDWLLPMLMNGQIEVSKPEP